MCPQCKLPCFQVAVTTRGGVKKYVVRTPSRATAIKRVARKNYNSIAAAVVNSPSTSKSAISNMALKIRREMKVLGSASHDSVLCDTVEAVKFFSWERVSLELFRNLPTLMALLSNIVRKPSDRQPLLCMLASQLLKSRHPKLGLVQRAVSIMMYGNGTAKQVLKRNNSLCVPVWGNIYVSNIKYRCLVTCKQ